MDDMLKTAHGRITDVPEPTHGLLDSVPEEVTWITATVVAFILPWLAGWDTAAFLLGGFVFAVWGGLLVIKMGNRLRANGVHLSDDVFFIAVFFSWIMVIIMLLRFGSRAIYVRK